MFYTAYVVKGANRLITFAFNGGSRRGAPLINRYLGSGQPAHSRTWTGWPRRGARTLRDNPETWPSPLTDPLLC